MLNKSNEEFQVIDPIHERLLAAFDWHLVSDHDQWDWMSVTEVLISIGIKDPNRGQTISAGRILKKLNGGRGKSSSGKKLIAVPSATLQI